MPAFLYQKESTWRTYDIKDDPALWNEMHMRRKMLQAQNKKRPVIETGSTTKKYSE
jgi:hypothetical protein